jgi:uncharacterized cupredoxin-like copper-binding protein
MAHVDRSARRAVAGMLGVFAAITAAGCGSDDHSQARDLGPRADVAADLSVAPGAKATAKAKSASTRAPAVTRSNGIITAKPTALVLRLSEFSVDPFINAVPKGRVKITILNKGDDEHELIVVRGKQKLPVKGGRVDDAVLERRHRVLGEISEVPAGRSASKTFVLKAGTYVLFCNIPGHYRAGMRASLIVRGR